jgi:hypothetical protein
MTVLRILVLFASLGLGGCATFDRMSPPPEAKQQINISVSTELPSRMSEMPTGVYQIPDSVTYVSGHQTGAGIDVLFGALGVLIAHAANESKAKGMLAGVESKLKPDMTASTKALLVAKINEHRLEKAMAVVDGPPAKGATSVSLLPYVVLTYVSDTVARPFVVLKASARDASGSEIWWSRYISAVKETRPLAGENGWSGNDGQPFKQAVMRALASATDVAVRDIGGKVNRSASKDVKLKAKYVFMQEDYELAGKLVERNGNTVVFIPQIGDVVVFAGVNIFEKDLVQLTESAPGSK